MEKKILILLLISIHANCIQLFGQWQSKAGNDEIDGKYKTSYVIGLGEFPYNKPMLVVNTYDEQNLNIYITGVFYAGCDNLKAIVKFDKEDKIREFRMTTNSNNDTWFFKHEFGSDSEHSSNLNFLESLKSNNKITIRLSNDCGEYDYKFNLAGSTKAINYVAGNYIQKVKGRLMEIEQEKKNTEQNERDLDKLFESKRDSLVIRVADKRMFLYDNQNLFGLRNDIFLEKGDTFKISIINRSSDYYRLRHSTGIDVVKFDTLYVKKSNVEEIKIKTGSLMNTK